MIETWQMQDDALYTREVQETLRRLARRAGRELGLRDYLPCERPAEVPQRQRAVALRGLQREDTALALLLTMAPAGVTLGDKLALYERALEAIRREEADALAKPVTFARFRAMIAEKIAQEAKRGGKENGA